MANQGIAEQLVAAYRAQAKMQLQQLVVEEYKKTAKGIQRQAFRHEAEEIIYRLRYEAWRAQVNDNRFRRFTASQMKQNADAGVKYATSLSTRDILMSTTRNATETTAEAVGLIGKVYGQAVRNKWVQITKIHQEVANQAINDMVAQYDSVRRSRKRGSSASYRQSDRFAGGLLRKALQSPLQAQATLDGVTFLNTTLLDNTAKQWARLNFGAGPRAGLGTTGARTGQAGSSSSLVSRGANRFSASAAFLEDAVGQSIPAFDATLPYGPKGAFWIPKGVFLEGGGIGTAVGPNKARRGMDAFHLFGAFESQVKKIPSDTKRGRVQQASLYLKVNQRKLTQGVQAWGFLEAGVNSLARNLPVADRNFMARIFQEAQENYEGNLPAQLAITPQTVGQATLLLQQAQARLLFQGMSSGFRR